MWNHSASTTRIFAADGERLLKIARDSPTALRRASSTLARRIVPFTRRDIQDEYNLGSRRILKDLGCRTGNGYVDLIGADRGIGLMQYGAKQTAAGIRVRFKSAGAPELFKGYFLATGLSGNRHAWARVGGKRAMQKGRYKGKRRQPIQALYEGSIAEFLTDIARRSRLSQFARDMFAAEMERLTGLKL